MTHHLSSESEPSSYQTQYLLHWTFANFIGGVIVGFLENNGLQFSATLFLAGAIAGSMQWVALRQAWPSMRWWPLASAVGWIAGSLIMMLGSFLYRPIVEALWAQLGLWEVFWLNIITGPIPMAGMAIAQGLILSQNYSRPSRVIGLWILISAIAGMVYGGVRASLCPVVCPFLPNLFVGVVDGLAWAAYGITTGWVLLIHQTHTGSPEQ